MASIFPTVGSCYKDTTTQQTFEVVAVDEANGAIEIQYNNGDIDEFELESWGLMSIIPVAATDDANAGYSSSYEDNWESDPAYINNGFNSPLEMIEADSFTGFDDYI
ncbi:DUF6763 family protein [Teredinibacter waterburyi]|jgi:hypothetical protein|uniref:DUF6763 family protein n=1 Tax=Teredinibacter waterburyi TaxID=1500538 RepID=UPI00165F4003|nr:DUF6763 family protein [Teredinibacter waterburyi]